MDYLVLVHPATLADVPEWYRGEALLPSPRRVGTTRLIDNMPVAVGPGGGAREVFSVPARTTVTTGSGMTLTVPQPAGRARAGLDHHADVIVVGSGIAGLTAALRLRQRVDTRPAGDQDGASTRARPQWAQGGIAAALDPADSPEEHLRDTLVAGVGLCDVERGHRAGHRGPAAGARAGRAWAPSSTATRPARSR